MSVQSWELAEELINDVKVIAELINMNHNEPSKILVVYWDTKSDKIRYSIGIFETNKAITKPMLLTRMAHIFLTFYL